MNVRVHIVQNALPYIALYYLPHLRGYKHSYDLSNKTECQEICRNADGENKPPCNPDDEIIKLNECLATSRTNAGDQSINVVIPCDRSANDKGTCEGIPATKCEPLCHYENSAEFCDPDDSSRRNGRRSARRLLFGGTTEKGACVCN